MNRKDRRAAKAGGSGQAQAAVSPLLAQALGHHQAGRLAQAEALYRQQLALNGRDADAAYLLGVLSAQKGSFDEALRLLSLAVQLRPAFADAWYNLGTLQLNRGDAPKAEEAFRHCLKQQPNHPGALWNLANLSLKAKKLEQAESGFRKFLTLQPSNLDAQYSLALALSGQNRMKEALALIRPLVERQPNPKLYALLGHILFVECDFDPAEAMLRKALEGDPTLVEPASELAALLRRLGRVGEAADRLKDLLARQPDDSTIRMNYALCLKDLGRCEEALALADIALAQDPDNADMRRSRSLMLLQFGRLRDGWRESEARFHTMIDPCPLMKFPFPRLEDISQARGRKVVVWPEQGIGDQITYASALGDLIELAQEVEILSPAKLLPLLRRSFPKARLVTDPKEAKADYHLPIGDLFKFFRNDISDFSGAPYLAVDEARLAHWRERLAKEEGALKIGLGWRSTTVSRVRQIHFFNQLADLEPLLRIPEITFVVVQPKCDPGEVEAVRKQFGCRLVRFEELDLFDDLDDTAAMMKALDLVISNGSANAILAGAIGVPVWQFFLADAHWDLLGTGDRMPWLGSLLPVQRRWDQAWDGVLARMADALRSSLAEGRLIAPASRPTV